MSVTFNSVDIEDRVPGLKIIASDPWRPPERRLFNYDKAREHGGVVAAAFYKDKRIRVNCSLGRDSRAAFEQSLQELESILQGKEKLLVFSQAGVDTEYTATREHVIVNDYAGGFAEVEITFLCSDPFGYNVSATTLYDLSNLVGGDYSFAINWPGNIAQAPVITITVNSVLGATNQGISIGDGTRTLTVSDDWEAADVLVIDCRNKTVKVNGSDIEFDGTFPEFSGSTPVVYSDEIAHRNFDIEITNQERNV